MTSARTWLAPGLRARARLGRAHLSPAHLRGVRRQRRLEAPGRLVRVRGRVRVRVTVTVRVRVRIRS